MIPFGKIKFALKSMPACVWALLLVPVANAGQSTATGFGPERADYQKNGTIMLQGTLSSNTTIGPGNYVIVNDVFVPPTTNLSIRSGTTIWFENGTRIEAGGSITALGDISSPIRFLILPKTEREQTALSSDSLWDGIALSRNASIVIRNAFFAGCRIGIKAPEGCKSAFVQNVTIVNGSPAFQMAGTPSLKASEKPIDFAFPTRSIKLLPEKTNKEGTSWTNVHWSRKLLTYGLGLASVALATGALMESLEADKYHNRGNKLYLAALDKYKDNGMPQDVRAEFLGTWQTGAKHTEQAGYLTIGGSVCVIGFVFTIPSIRKHEK